MLPVPTLHKSRDDLAPVLPGEFGEILASFTAGTLSRVEDIERL